MRSHAECAWEGIVATAAQATTDAPLGHVADCASCGAMVHALRAVTTSFAEWRMLERASDESLAPLLARMQVAAQGRAAGRVPVAGRVIETMAGWRQRWAMAGVSVAEVWAVLSGDSWGPLHAVRGAGATGTRFLQYATEEFTVAVSLEGETAAAEAALSPRNTLRGQVVPRQSESLAAGAVAYLHAGAEDRACALTEFGEFLFEAIPTAGLDVRIAVGPTLIRMPELPAAS